MLREFGIDDILLLLTGAKWTVLLSLIAFTGGGLLGLMVAIGRVFGPGPLKFLIECYIRAIQGTPLLGQLFLFYFGFSIFGFDVSAWVAISVAMVFFSSAFLGDSWRGCIEAIPKTQWEAADALGMSFVQKLCYVVLPQAARIAIPSTVGFMAQIVKNTSLAAVVGFVDLLRMGQLVTAATFQPLTVYLVVAFMYFAMCYPLSQWSRILERRYNATHQH
ncbi:amino acid ABC transporter permease [Aliishimia ponticola]|uniref:Amino acid ABC transporter permease n=1 Tax=Aliishimia ponticola TaxID=2499833 RepID=A0A4S4N5K1_9RHOB|nr:amino acid ABC transporter permease [Aliishimia ponticola]THH34362.1 amino acid ABC transporter permease [Aliishimia ponticola]